MNNTLKLIYTIENIGTKAKEMEHLVNVKRLDLLDSKIQFIRNWCNFIEILKKEIEEGEK